MIRTYLKTKFLHVPEPLYVYRITGDNTWLERNAKIQTMTVELFHKYAFKLAERDAELRNLFKVEIGPKKYSSSGYITLFDVDADLNQSLNTQLSIDSDKVGVLILNHTLQNFKNQLFIMKEIYRVLADGAWVFIQVPSTDGRGAFQDPRNVSFWNENNFLYYTRSDRAKYIKDNNVRFQSFRLDTEWWEDKVAVTNAWLCAVKSSERRPHLTLI